MTTSSQAITMLAQAIGEAPEAIKTGNTDWAGLMQSGLIVKLHIRRWRGRTALSMEDIGVPINGEQKLYDELLTLGTKLLAPKEIIKELDAIDSGARKCLERFAFQTYWGSFIPASAYEEWKTKDAEYEARYYAIRDRFLSEYDSIMEDLLDKYAEAARLAYQRRHKLQHAGMDFDLSINAEDKFVEAFMARITSLIPGKAMIADSFRYERELTFIPLPSLMAADAAEADRITLGALKDKTALQAERDRQTMITRMHAEVIAEAKAQKQALVDGFMRDIVAQLRSLIYDAAMSVAETTARNGSLHPRSVVALQTVVERVRQLNFFGDPDSDKMIAQLQAIVDQPAETRDASEIQGALQQVMIVTRQSLLTLGEAPRSAKTLGVPDAPTLVQTKAARSALGLPDLDGNGLGLKAPKLL